MSWIKSLAISFYKCVHIVVRFISVLLGLFFGNGKLAEVLKIDVLEFHC